MFIIIQYYLSNNSDKQTFNRNCIYYISKIGAILWLGTDPANTNFGEHWSKSPGDRLSECEAWLAGVQGRPARAFYSARRGFRRACDGSTQANIILRRTIISYQSNLLSESFSYSLSSLTCIS